MFYCGDYIGSAKRRESGRPWLMLASHRSPSCLLLPLSLPIQPVFLFYFLLSPWQNGERDGPCDGRIRIQHKHRSILPPRGKMLTKHQPANRWGEENLSCVTSNLMFVEISRWENLFFLSVCLVIVFCVFVSAPNCTGIQVIAFSHSGYRAASGEPILECSSDWILIVLPQGAV